MKNYTITVNGNVYEVTVEEGAAGAAPAPAAAPKAAPKAAPAAAPKAAARKQQQAALHYGFSAGKVCKVEASVGQAVKAGDNIVILEAMKMEIPVVAPQD